MSAAASRSIWRECGLLMLIAVGPALITFWIHPRHPQWAWRKPVVAEVEVGTISLWPEKILWVDARPADAYAERHIPGAIPLNQNEWAEQLPALLQAWRPGMKVVVYCDSPACGASQAVALRLQQGVNLPDIYVLKGGWDAWTQSQSR